MKAETLLLDRVVADGLKVRLLFQGTTRWRGLRERAWISLAFAGLETVGFVALLLSLDPGGQRVCDQPFPLSGLATSCCLFCLFAFPSLSVAPRRLLSDTTAPILVFCLRDCPLPNPLTHITAASPRWQALFCSPVPWWVPIAPK